MAGQQTSQGPQGSFWPEPPHVKTGRQSPHPYRSSDLKEFLDPIDESPDFHDPYSDLNLFLSQQIKTVFQEAGFVKKWSVYLQEKLIEKITPEFQKKFPSYRLGASSLRKLWEKIAYYSEQIQSQKEALTKEGRLNIPYLIKENLKQYFQHRSFSDMNPYHFAHQLALKISDCMATMEGVRPTLDQLSRTIWAVERHMLSAEALLQLKSPYDELDKWDKLVVKTVLEISGKNPQLSQKELETSVKESIRSLQELPSFASLERVTATVSALLADRLYPSSPFHTLFVDSQKNAALSFVRRQITLYKNSCVSNMYGDVVRRTMSAYVLASQLPKDLSAQDLTIREDNPQALNAFVAAQRHLSKGDENILHSSYAEAIQLPQMPSEMLEMVIWQTINELEKLLDDLPYRVGQRIDEEITHILIDNPRLSFQSLVATVVQFFKKAKELATDKNWGEIEKKISLWTHQGDLLCRWLKLENDADLLTMISDLWRTSQGTLSHTDFLSQIAQDYFRKHPQLSSYAPQVAARIAIFYKYAWYALFSKPEESSLDRFIRWHLVHLSHLEPGQRLVQLEEIFKKTIPLVPFDRALSQKQVQAEEDKRDAQ